MTASQIEEACIANEEVLCWAASLMHINKQRISAPITVAVIAANIHGVGKDELRSFLRLAFRNDIDETLPKETNQAILNYGNAVGVKYLTGSRLDRFTLMNATKAAIDCYDRGLKRIRSDGKDLYPITFDKDWRIVKEY